MRELGELYRIYYGDGFNDRALDYILYVVEREKKYTIEHLLKSVQEHTEKRLGFYFYDSMRYMDNTYNEFFYPKFLAHQDPETLGNDEIYNIIVNRKKPCNDTGLDFVW